MIRQGEVRGYRGSYARVVVVSTDETSNGAFPIVAPVDRDGEDIPPYAIGLADQDPFKGAIDVARLTFVPDPDQLGEPVAMLTGDTWQRVRDAVLDLFDDS